MTEQDVLNLLELVMATYPNTRIKDAEGMVNSWVMAFCNTDASDVYKATRLHMEESKYFPTPADIKERIMRASIIYDEPEPPVKQIEASTKSYLDEQVDYIMEHFQEGGDFGWKDDQCSKCRRYNVCHK